MRISVSVYENQKRDSRSKNVAERQNVLAVVRLSWNEYKSVYYLPTDYKTLYTTMQPLPPPVPSSASMGKGVAGSELEVSKATEESVVKRSIGGCQL